MPLTAPPLTLGICAGELGSGSGFQTHRALPWAETKQATLQSPIFSLTKCTQQKTTVRAEPSWPTYSHQFMTLQPCPCVLSQPLSHLR